MLDAIASSARRAVLGVVRGGSGVAKRVMIGPPLQQTHGRVDQGKTFDSVPRQVPQPGPRPCRPGGFVRLNRESHCWKGTCKKFLQCLFWAWLCPRPCRIQSIRRFRCRVEFSWGRLSPVQPEPSRPNSSLASSVALPFPLGFRESGQEVRELPHFSGR